MRPSPTPNPKVFLIPRPAGQFACAPKRKKPKGERAHGRSPVLWLPRSSACGATHISFGLFFSLLLFCAGICLRPQISNGFAQTLGVWSSQLSRQVGECDSQVVSDMDCSYAPA